MSKSSELKYKYNLPREVFDYLEKLEYVEQDIEEYERRISVSNETIDIYEKLVKHVETQRDDLYQELQSNEMLIEELEQQKAELINILKSIVKAQEDDDEEFDRISKEIIKVLNKHNIKI